MERSKTFWMIATLGPAFLGMSIYQNRLATSDFTEYWIFADTIRKAALIVPKPLKLPPPPTYIHWKTSPKDLGEGETFTLEISVSGDAVELMNKWASPVKRITNPDGTGFSIQRIQHIADTGRLQIQVFDMAVESDRSIEIEPRSRSVQPVSGGRNPKWLWVARPIKSDSLQILMSGNAIIGSTISEDQSKIMTLYVHPRLEFKIRQFFKEFWHFLFTAILIPVFNFYWKFFTKPKDKNGKKQPAGFKVPSP